MKYTLSKESFVAILKVMGWSTATALITSLIMVIENADVPAEYVFLIPVINSFLYTVKEFISDKR